MYLETNPSESFCAVRSTAEPGPPDILKSFNGWTTDLATKRISAHQIWDFADKAASSASKPPAIVNLESGIVRRNQRMGREETQPNDDITVTGAIQVRKHSQKVSKQSSDILTSIQYLEKRTFPASEALSIETEVKKRNTRLLYVQSTDSIAGFLIYIHTPSRLRIHKVCVAEKFRRQGIATALISRVCSVARKTGKDIDLWVDEDRIPARYCYSACGFQRAGASVKDYYGPGRNGMRLVWSSE